MLIINRLFRKIVENNRIVFPYIGTFAFACLLIETYTYEGFLWRNFFVSSKGFFLATILSSIILLFSGNKPKNLYFDELSSLLFKLNRLFFPVLLISYSMMISIENQNYSNYIFSRFHINPENYLYVVYLGLILLIIDVFLSIKQKHYIKKENFSIIYTKIFVKLGTWFVFLTSVTFLVLLIESYKYQGFFSKHFLIDAKFFLGAVIVAGYYLVLAKNDVRESIKLKSLLVVNRFMLPLLIISYLAMVYFEATNYPNFIYGNYHILPETFVYVLVLSCFLGLMDKMISNHSIIRMELNLNRKEPEKVIMKSLALLLIVVYLIQNGVVTINKTLIENFRILSQPTASYEEKMEFVWGTFYIYMNAIKKYTPDDAVIAIPPSEEHWLHTGNDVLVNYFLYPRKLVTSDIYNMPTEEYDYALLAKGLWKGGDSEYGWPKVILKTDIIYYFDIATKSVSEAYKDFDPKEPINKSSWGLIKIHKE